MKNLFIIILISYTSFSQDTTYYNNKWDVTTIDSAVYFFTKPFRRVDYPLKADDVDTIKNNLKVKKNNKTINKIDFCYSLIPENEFIGKKVKIYYRTHSYEQLNLNTTDVDWPNEEIRQKSGNSYSKWKYPNNGDTVEIVWIFKSFPNPEYKSKYPDNVYLVKLNDYFIPISGKGLTMVDKEAYSYSTENINSTENVSSTESFKKERDPISLVLAPGINFQKQYFGELNLLFSKIDCGMCSPCVISGPFIGVESNFNQNNWLYGFKSGYQFAGLFLSLRGSFINYIDKGHSDLRILPEIGLSFLGIANLNYGYNIPLLNFESTLISRHRISLVINLSRELW
jgi:hypothetical protein